MNLKLGKIRIRAEKENHYNKGYGLGLLVRYGSHGTTLGEPGVNMSLIFTIILIRVFEVSFYWKSLKFDK